MYESVIQSGGEGDQKNVYKLREMVYPTIVPIAH